MGKRDWQEWVMGGTAVFFLLLILLIASGVFDPQPVGSPQWAIQLDPLILLANERAVRWLDTPLPDNDFSLRLDTAHSSGELDVAFGLVIDNFWVGVSPLGYVTILAGETAVLPLQPWPHVTAGGNEIWLDRRENQITIRINRELLWTGKATFTSWQVGVWGQSWGETAVIHFPALTLYHP